MIKNIHWMNEWIFENPFFDLRKNRCHYLQAVIKNSVFLFSPVNFSVMPSVASFCVQQMGDASRKPEAKGERSGGSFTPLFPWLIQLDGDEGLVAGGFWFSSVLLRVFSYCSLGVASLLWTSAHTVGTEGTKWEWDAIFVLEKMNVIIRYCKCTGKIF